jgi:hypothetical protein
MEVRCPAQESSVTSGEVSGNSSLDRVYAARSESGGLRELANLHGLVNRHLRVTKL